MRQKNYRIRQLAVAAIGAVTAVSGIAVLGVGTAQAAGPNTTVVSAAPTTMHAGVPNQPAANEAITIQPTFTWVTGDTFTLTVTDSATTHPVLFSGSPTVTPANVAGSTLPTVTSAAVGNVLTITFTNGGTASLAQPILVSGISYSPSGTDVSGPVTVTPGFTGTGTAWASISPASAATSNATIVGAPTIGLTAATTPSVGAGLNNQAAGNDSFGFAGQNTGWFAGDQLTIRVAPNTGANCSGPLASPVQIGFSSAPTVSATTVTGQTTPTFSAVGLTQSAACTGTSFFDQAIVTLTNSGTITGTGAIGPSTQPVTITFGGISYNVTAAVPTGNVSVAGLYNASVAVAASTTGATTGPSNADVGKLSVTANQPPVGLVAGSTNQPISNVVITEAQPGAVPTGNVCVIPSSGTFNTTSTPIVTASGGGAVVSAPTVTTGTQLLFSVTTASSTAAATYTVSNLHVDTLGSPGPVTVTVTDGGSGSACGTALTTTLTLYNTFALNRIFGQTADGTAASELATAFATSSPATNGCPATHNVVLATDQNFPDALSASYLAAKFGTGVLLTPTNALASETVTALRVAGISHVYIVGGPLAVAQNVVAAIGQEPVYNCGGTVPDTNPTTGAQVLESVTQVYGQTQYDTAQTVAQFFGSTVGPGSFVGAYPTSTSGTSAYNTTSGLSGTLAPSAAPTATAIVATGQTFPDAMSASAMSYAKQWPILLTQQGSLSSQASGAITNLGIKQVIVMGGPIAVSDTVVTQLEALGVSVLRIAGTDYTNTAQLLGQFELSANGLNWAAGHVYNIDVSRGDFFADALAGSALAGLAKAPIVLTFDPNTLGAGIPALFTTEHALSPPNQVSSINVLGGPIAVTPATVNAVLASIPG